MLFQVVHYFVLFLCTSFTERGIIDSRMSETCVVFLRKIRLTQLKALHPLACTCLYKIID